MPKPNNSLTSVAIPRKSEARPAAAARMPAPASISAEVPRKTVSARLTIGLQERLRRHAYETRQDKQVTIEEAVDAYLRQQGF